MSGKAVTKRVGMDGVVEARASSGSLAGAARCFLVDWIIRSMPTVAGKEPAGFSWQPAPVLAQFFEQLRTEHDLAVFPTFSSANVNHHALAIDIADLQVC